MKQFVDPLESSTDQWYGKKRRKDIHERKPSEPIFSAVSPRSFVKIDVDGVKIAGAINSVMGWAIT